MVILSIVALVCVPLGLKILWPVIFPEERLCYTCGHACRRVPAADDHGQECSQCLERHWV